MRSLVSVSAMSAVAVLLLSCAGHFPQKVPDFFSFYAGHEAAYIDADGTLFLDLHIDHHYPDCMAPDNFGHRMKIRFQLDRSGERCVVVGAISNNNTYGEGRLTRSIRPRNRFVPIGSPDLSDPELEELVLHDSAQGQSLFIFREGYEFYENSLVRADPATEGYGDEEQEIYPATGTEIYRWKFGEL